MNLNLTVADEMSADPITIMPHQTLKEAYKVMYAKNIRHLPVVDQDGKVCGIISDRDIQRGMDSKVASTIGFRFESLSLSDDKHVQDYMAWPLKMISREASLKEAASIMLHDRVSALVVVENEEVVGIITTDDMLHTLIFLLDDKSGDMMNINEYLKSDRPKLSKEQEIAEESNVIPGYEGEDEDELIGEEEIINEGGRFAVAVQ